MTPGRGTAGAQTPADAQHVVSTAEAKFSTGPLSDLANLSPDQVLALWSKVEKAKATREADPELRAAILRRAEALDPSFAAQMRDQLDEAHPAVVLEAHFRDLIADMPALGSFAGAFPRRDRVVIPTPTEWLADDPRRLAGVVAEMGRFTEDRAKIVAGALALADTAGIDAELADRVVCAALRTLPNRASR